MVNSGSGSTGSKYSLQVVTKFMCRFCARQFDTPGEMQAHISSHGRGKATSHSCYVCGKTYSTPSKLQRHVRVHSGERPYACNICGRRFTRSDHVKQHLKVHMPQKQRNVCRLCDMKFLRRQTLHSHLQQSHGVSTVFTCHRCGEAFDLITQLHTHKESHQSLYPPNVNEAITGGGIAIKKEPGMPEDDNNPVVGLAKFSLGPQPQVAEDVLSKHKPDPSSLHAVTSHIAVKNTSTNGLAEFQLSEDIAMESIIKDAIKNAVKNEMELAYGESTQTTDNDAEYNDFQTSTSDDMNMYILPSDIKKEPTDETEESANATTENGSSNDLSKECQTMTDDIEEESDDEEENKDDKKKINDDQSNDEMSIKNNQYDKFKYINSPKSGTTHVNPPQEIRVGPPSGTGIKKLKYKVLGPASYKAAMQQKLRARMKTYVPISTIPIVNTAATTHTAVANNNSLTKLVSSTRTSWGGTLTTLTPGSTTTVTKLPAGAQVKKMMRCEHCCIWFEDYAMSLLHNSLHSADDTDPFTCRKCLKKMGNRLEFTAHMVWHLEPTMDG